MATPGIGIQSIHQPGLQRISFEDALLLLASVHIPGGNDERPVGKFSDKKYGQIYSEGALGFCGLTPFQNALASPITPLA